VTDSFELLMISAMYENGGNTTHRHLDGHPQLFVYPFESQLGTRHVGGALASLFPLKYRWPAFPLTGTPEADYLAIIDEECKVRIRTPHVSKFRDWPMDLDDDERRDRYVERVRAAGRSRGGNVAAFFQATFDAWHDRRASGRERVYVGYSPIVAVDTADILADLPGAHVLHVVRNPWSAYADTLRRPVPLPLQTYLLGWTLNQYFALLAREAAPERVHIVRFEDLVEDPAAALAPVCAALGIDQDESLSAPTWNGAPLENVAPWGTIREPTPEANLRTALELTAVQREEVRRRAWRYLDELGYTDFLTSGAAAPVGAGRRAV